MRNIDSATRRRKRGKRLLEKSRFGWSISWFQSVDLEKGSESWMKLWIWVRSWSEAWMIPSMDSGTRGMLRSFSGSILELFWSYKVDVEKIYNLSLKIMGCCSGIMMLLLRNIERIFWRNCAKFLGAVLELF